jgi:hypothetical protein
VWTGGDSSGIISVKNIYKALINSLDFPFTTDGYKSSGNGRFNLKIKLFLWLAANHKVLTWDSLQKKGWEGPGICQLCNCNSEDIDHILIHCPFTKEVWNHFFQSLSFKFKVGRYHYHGML